MTPSELCPHPGPGETGASNSWAVPWGDLIVSLVTIAGWAVVFRQQRTLIRRAERVDFVRETVLQLQHLRERAIDFMVGDENSVRERVAIIQEIREIDRDVQEFAGVSLVGVRKAVTGGSFESHDRRPVTADSIEVSRVREQFAIVVRRLRKSIR